MFDRLRVSQENWVWYTKSRLTDKRFASRRKRIRPMLSDENIPFLSFLYEVSSTPTKTISIETDNEMTKRK